MDNEQILELEAMKESISKNLFGVEGATFTTTPETLVISLPPERKFVKVEKDRVNSRVTLNFGKKKRIKNKNTKSWAKMRQELAQMTEEDRTLMFKEVIELSGD